MQVFHSYFHLNHHFTLTLTLNLVYLYSSLHVLVFSIYYYVIADVCIPSAVIYRILQYYALFGNCSPLMLYPCISDVHFIILSLSVEYVSTGADDA